ncbi:MULTISPECIES: hypothetical protein [Streptomyces]|uniref:hypothetical protein n=1 Tax=Streptomyces TaxID=1883 RepID=UPI001E606959|nr:MULTISPECIES: hypothetical protein [Streptomyces]UFQ15986.1 hypothetical protein J2N69_13815 [Streptomyces huasconensis]WCL85589.1 hypothetical protein PPN52_13825 [Streptomyces sp. JCM 35825]
MSDGRKPRVGDEVEYAPGCRAVVTGVREGVPVLRGPGGLQWPAADPEGLRGTKLREERRADGDWW